MYGFFEVGLVSFIYHMLLFRYEREIGVSSEEMFLVTDTSTFESKVIKQALKTLMVWWCFAHTVEDSDKQR